MDGAAAEPEEAPLRGTGNCRRAPRIGGTKSELAVAVPSLLTELARGGRGRRERKREGIEERGGCPAEKATALRGWMKQPTEARGWTAAGYPFPAHAPRVGLEPRGLNFLTRPAGFQRERARERYKIGRAHV